MRSPARRREREDDVHWSIVSSFTIMNADYRQDRRAASRQQRRLRLGLALVRLGLNVAPLTVDDLAAESPGTEG